MNSAYSERSSACRFTPVCLSIPYYTRLRDVLKNHSSSWKDCCFAVMRDGGLLGIVAERGDALDLLAATRVEERMQPISWVEAVDFDVRASEAHERLKRYRRRFVPVVKHDGLVGIVHYDRVLKAAYGLQDRPGSAATDGVKI
jgi:hypothetical protein